MNSRFICSLLALTVFLAPIGATAQMFVWDPANFAKNALTASQTAAQLTKLATQIRNQYQQIQYQVDQINLAKQQLRALPTQVWSDVQSNMGKLTQLIDQQHLLSVNESQLDPAFKKMYPDYIPQYQFPELYHTLDVNTHDAALDVLKTAQIIVKQHGSTTEVLTANRKAITSATGQMQVLQAGATMAAQTVEQLQKLQQLDAVRAAYEVQYYEKASAQVTHAQHNDEAFSRWIRTANPANTSLPPL